MMFFLKKMRRSAGLAVLVLCRCFRGEAVKWVGRAGSRGEALARSLAAFR